MNSVIEVLAPRYGIAWYPWAVQYFFLIAVSYSALLLTVPGLLFGKKNYESLAKVALLVTVYSERISNVVNFLPWRLAVSRSVLFIGCRYAALAGCEYTHDEVADSYARLRWFLKSTSSHVGTSTMWVKKSRTWTHRSIRIENR